jgi:1,4-dihydroxy-2-naphthoate octaprenyltransferase
MRVHPQDNTESFSELKQSISDRALKIETLRKIILLGRFKFPIIAFWVFSLGALLAVVSGATFALDRFVMGSAIVVAALLSVNYGNDYFDVEVDRYNEPTAISGGSRILVENPELRSFAKWFAVFSMGLSVTLAAVSSVLFSFPVFFVLFVLFGNLLSWFYAAPPLKLAYRGFSEIATVVTVGLMLPGTGYFILNAGFDTAFGVFALPFAVYALAFIISVETPDLEGDRKGNKRTLIVLKGRRFGFATIAFSLFTATLYFLLISTTKAFMPLVDFRLLALFSLAPLITGFLGLAKRPESRDLATKLASLNVSSISLFLLIVDLYFIILLG